MKVEEATKVKEKLDDVLLVVEEYGKQSEQFSKARNDLFDVLGVMNNTNFSLGQLLTACDQYLKKASEVIDGEYFVKIQGVINEINATASNLEKCNENTSAESVKLIEESKKQLSGLADTLSKKIQASIDKVRDMADDLQTYSKQASDNAKELIKSSSNEMLSLVEKLKTTCDSLMKESDQLKKNDAEIIKSQGKTIADIENLQEVITAEIQKNNKLCNETIKALNDIEQKSFDNKTEIVNAVRDTVSSGVSELKCFEENCYNKLNTFIEKIDAKYQLKTKKILITGGIIAAIIIGLQISNIII